MDNIHNKRKRMKKIIAVLVLVCSMMLPAYSQSYSGPSGNATYQSEKNIVTYPVQIWGEVVRPGIYDIPIGSDFLAALSFAGGPTDLAKLKNVRLIRGKLLEGETDPLIKIDVESYLINGNKNLLPEVRPGDTIIVAPRFMKGFHTTMTYVQSVMSILNVITMVQYYSGK